MSVVTAEPWLAQRIERPGLWELAAAGTSAKLVLLQAPAGFGKTVALRQFRQQLENRGTRVVWLTLHERHNSYAGFSAGLQEQLKGAIRGGAKRTDDPLERIVNSMEPLALFLDNFERIDDAATFAHLRAGLDQLPQGVQLFVATRTPLPFSLSRMLANGELRVIGAPQLRWSFDEAWDFLSRGAAAPVPMDEALKLHAATDGWPAALQLASRALRRCETTVDFSSLFAAGSEELAQYIHDEVLMTQPEEVRGFLLQTSVLRSLDPGVCQALTGTAGCGELLSRLCAAGLLERAPGPGPTRFLPHPLLREHFIRELRDRRGPDELVRLHRLAAGWHERDRQPLVAVSHALEGGDHGLAASILAVHGAAVLEQGRMSQLARWIQMLPRDTVSASSALQLIHVWSTCFTAGPQPAMEVMKEHGLQDSADAEVVPHRVALQTLLLAMLDRHAEACDLGARALGELPSASRFADAMLCNVMANVYAAVGEGGKARNLLEKSRPGEAPCANGFSAMYSAAVDGTMDLLEGRFRQAKARLSIAVTAIRGVASGYMKGNAWAGVLYALCVYESDEMEQAARLLSNYVPRGRDAGQPDHLALGYVLLARIAWERGDADRAFYLLDELQTLGRVRALPRLVAGARLERSRLYLTRGNEVAAREELECAASSADWDRISALRLLGPDLDYLQLARLRLAVLFGNAQAALAGLDIEIAQAHSQRRYRRALKLRVIRCGALHRLNDASAMAAVRSVLGDCCSEGYMRMLLDEKQSLLDALQTFAHQEDEPLRRSDPILSAYLSQVLGCFGAEAHPGVSAHHAVLASSLSAKEIRALRLMAEGHSNDAMAAKLFVSNSTVRTHLRSINAKLGTRTRTEAVAIGRRAGIIS